MYLDVGESKMQYANLVFATFLFLLMLFACSSNQSSKVSQQNHSENSSNTRDNESQEKLLATIPVDGKLRDEHLKMYVSVKIKQEQLRYQQQTSTSENKEQVDANFQHYTDRDLEKIAFNDFGFDSEIYYWSKRIIQDTLLIYVGGTSTSDTDHTKRDVLTHNLSLLAKHRDELRFANSYRLKLNTSPNPQSALKNISNTQLASTPEPST